MRVVKDSLALAALLAALLSWLPWRMPGASPGTLHVAAHGSDLLGNGSPGRPYRSIRRAAALARPGDVVLIRPGVYRERITIRTGGEPGRPVVFRAATPGSVTITGVAGESLGKQRWRHEGNGIYLTRVPWPVHRVAAAGETLFPCASLAQLRRLAGLTRPVGSFFLQRPDNLLYLSLPDRGDPATVPLTIHGPVPEPLANGVWRAANVWVEADHLRFEGIRFEEGVGAGIGIWRGNDVEIVDCLFSGARRGVDAISRLGPVTGLRLARSAYHNYPMGDWRRSGMQWRDTYGVFGDSTLVASAGDGAVIAGNLVLHAEDGLHVTTGDGEAESGVEVSGNLIARCTDDAVEFDGFARKIRFRGNLIFDCFVSLAPSPVLAGPVCVEENLFLHPSGGLNGAQAKLLSPWLRRPSPWNGAIRNVEIRDNTFVGNWLCWYGKPPTPARDIRVYRNLFAVQRMMHPLWPAGVTDRGNVYVDLPESGYPNPGRDDRWRLQRGGAVKGKPWTMARPGPRWLDWRTLPAAAALLRDLDRKVFIP